MYNIQIHRNEYVESRNRLPLGFYGKINQGSICDKPMDFVAPKHISSGEPQKIAGLTP